jgi:Leucine-rich repeat (LRR) protein
MMENNEPATPSPASPPRRRIGPWRTALWLVLLGGSIAFWLVAQRSPRLLEPLGAWLLPASETGGGSEAELQAEQEASRQLRNCGALVVAEPVSHAISNVNFRGNGKTIDDAALELLAPLYRLTSLNLSDAALSNDQLQHLGSLPSLASLVLSDTPVSDDGLAHLRGLRRLEMISLCGTQVTDAGLVHLAALPTLRIVDLSHTQVGDDGLAHLAALPNLNWLLLKGDRITDAGLEHLHSLKSLRQLNLMDTKVSREGIAALQEALPGIFVDR